MSLLLPLRQVAGLASRLPAAGCLVTHRTAQCTPDVRWTLTSSFTPPLQQSNASTRPRQFSTAFARPASVGIRAHLRSRPGMSIPNGRGVATQATSAAAATTTSASVQFPPAASPVIEQVDWLHSFFLPYVRPFAPILDSLPTYIGLSADAPHAHVISLVVLTIVVRTAVTLPVTLWQRARTRRLRDKFLPAMREIQRTLPRQIVQQCREKGLTTEEMNKEVHQQMRTQRKALMKQHKCAPLYTIATALGVNIPLFLFITFTIRTALMTKGLTIGEEVVPWWEPPAELSAKFEADARALAMRGMDPQVLTEMIKIQGPTLSHVDKDMFAPVVLGATTFINVELSQWQRKSLNDIANPTMAADDKDTSKALSEAQQKARASADYRNKVFDNALRGLAIGFVFVASQAPVGLVVYWISSSLYTLAQTAAFSYIDQRRARLAPRPPPPQPVSVIRQQQKRSLRTPGP